MRAGKSTETTAALFATRALEPTTTTISGGNIIPFAPSNSPFFARMARESSSKSLIDVRLSNPLLAYGPVFSLKASEKPSVTMFHHLNAGCSFLFANGTQDERVVSGAAAAAN